MKTGRAARKLASLGAATLTDNGVFELGGHVDGERWWFELKSNVSIAETLP